jgi:dTDP-4-dehydrorhamnose 3,5-epimerase
LSKSSQGGALFAARSAEDSTILFQPTELQDAWLIKLELKGDARGAFARTFCEDEFGRQGLATRFVQHSRSISATRGTLRGMHFQRAPHEEVKLVSCLKGAIWDVIIDLRPHSPTFRRWQGFELTAGNRDQLYIPEGFAHGFQTLSDTTEVQYLISAFYEPRSSAGVRFDDPAFGIEWPLPVSVIADKDRNWPDFIV